jgi:hypothetical protein
LFLNGKRVMNRSFEGLRQMIDEASAERQLHLRVDDD